MTMLEQEYIDLIRMYLQHNTGVMDAKSYKYVGVRTPALPSVIPCVLVCAHKDLTRTDIENVVMQAVPIPQTYELPDVDGEPWVRVYHLINFKLEDVVEVQAASQDHVIVAINKNFETAAMSKKQYDYSTQVIDGMKESFAATQAKADAERVSELTAMETQYAAIPESELNSDASNDLLFKICELQQACGRKPLHNPNTPVGLRTKTVVVMGNGTAADKTKRNYVVHCRTGPFSCQFRDKLKDLKVQLAACADAAAETTVAIAAEIAQMEKELEEAHVRYDAWNEKVMKPLHEQTMVKVRKELEEMNADKTAFADFLALPQLAGTKWEKAIRLFSPKLNWHTAAEFELQDRLRYIRDSEWPKNAKMSIVARDACSTVELIKEYLRDPLWWVIDARTINRFSFLEGFCPMEVQSFFDQDLSAVTDADWEYFAKASQADQFAAPFAPKAMARELYVYMLAADTLNMFADWMIEHRNKKHLILEKYR